MRSASGLPWLIAITTRSPRCSIPATDVSPATSTRRLASVSERATDWPSHVAVTFRVRDVTMQFVPAGLPEQAGKGSCSTTVFSVSATPDAVVRGSPPLKVEMVVIGNDLSPDDDSVEAPQPASVPGRWRLPRWIPLRRPWSPWIPRLLPIQPSIRQRSFPREGPGALGICQLRPRSSVCIAAIGAHPLSTTCRERCSNRCPEPCCDACCEHCRNVPRNVLGRRPWTAQPASAGSPKTSPGERGCG